MLLAGRIASKFRRFAGVSSAPNAVAVLSTCARIGRNTARQGMSDNKPKIGFRGRGGINMREGGLFS